MKEALDKTDSPYRHVVSCLVSVLEQTWGTGEVESRESREETRIFSKNRVSPIRLKSIRCIAFPVADFTGGCGSACGSEPEVTHCRCNFQKPLLARHHSTTPKETRKP